MPMQLQEISALIDLARLQEDQAVASINVCGKALHEVLGTCSTLQQHTNTSLLPVSAVVQVLQVFSNIPQCMQHVPLEEVAAVLCEHQQQLARLDSLLGLVCLLAAGDVCSKLHLCFNLLIHRNGGNSLSLPKLLQILSGLPLTAAAAQLILGQATTESIAALRSSKTACAAQQQRMQVLEAVAAQAFEEADQICTGCIQPGPQMQQLLFSIAAQLTAIIVGTAPVPEVAANFAAAVAAEAMERPGATSTAAVTGDGSPALTKSSAVSNISSRSTSSLGVAQQQQPDPFSQPAQQHVRHGLPAFQPASHQGDNLQQQSSNSAGQADVVIMDVAGNCMHYTTTVAEAAAAASAGRLPSSSSEVHVYQQPAGAGRQRGGLATAESVTQQLSLMVGAQQQQQQLRQQLQQQQLQQLKLKLQDRDSVATEASRASVFFTPVHSTVGTARPTIEDGFSPVASASVTETGNNPGPSRSGSGGGDSLKSKSRLVSAVQMSKRMVNNIRRATGEDLPVADAPASAENDPGMAGAAGGPAAGGAAELPAVPGATQAITSTAGTLARALQRNIAAASARVLVHCSVCFLLTTMVILGDAALVAGLHAAAGLPLATSFGITVGANMVLVVALFAALLLVRCFNNATGRNIEQALSGPEAQQIDYILNNISTAIELLKKSEEQSGGAQHRPGSTAYNSNSTSAVHRTSSYGREPDPEAGFGAPSAGLGRLRTVWSAVGRMAGFLQQAEDLGPQESLQSQGLPSPVLGRSTLTAGSGDALSLQQQQLGTANGTTDSGGIGSVGNSTIASLASQSTTCAAFCSSAGLQQQSRSARMRGIGGSMGASAPGISVQQAYPQA